VGEIVATKLGTMRNFLAAGVAVAGLLLSGCGGGGGAANVITITISSSSGLNLILGQSTTLTTTVNGATNTNVNWTPQFLASKAPCQYTTTTTDSTGKSTTSALLDCPSDGSLGTLTNVQTTGTAVYTAPSTLPPQKTYPGLQIVITAQSVQNTTKTGKITITLNSGISVVLTPKPATVPTGEPEQFSVLLTNDNGPTKGVTWLLTQNVPTSTLPSYSQQPTCSPTCGTITPDTNNPNVAVYKAPSTIPTAITPTQTDNNTCPSNVTIVATSVADPMRLDTGTITIVTGAPITFNGITPTIAPQGASLWDIYLDAPHISSSSKINLMYASGGTVVKDSTSGQIKVLFPIPTSTTPTTSSACTTTNPTSTGARLRLNAADLQAAGTVTLSVTDPVETVTAPNPSSAYSYTIIPVRPTSIASVPDDVVQGKLAQQTRVIIDGGYFGPGGSVNGTNSLASVIFQGGTVIQDPNNPSTSQRLDALLSTSQINAGNPGLYPLLVSRTVTPLPNPNNPAVTNIAVFPDYSVTPPAVVSTVTPGYNGIPAGTNPSAVDIDPALGVAAVAEVGSDVTKPGTVQFYSIGLGKLTAIDSTGAACGTACPLAVGKIPTGLSVNRANHTVAVVNYGDQSVTVLPIPVPGASSQNPAAGTPFTVDISKALQNSVSPAPLPYSIGVDPDSNLALVAYSSTSTSSPSNLGFTVNLNPDNPATPNPYGCVLDHAINSGSTKVGQCLLAQVTLNTGAYPQIATAPHGHLALVTPGGSGVVRGVDVTKLSSENVILSSTLTAGLVTVTIDTSKCPNPASKSCPFTMVPGNAGTVLITGVKPGTLTNTALFNGTFSVSVTSSNSFTYVVNNATASDSGTGGTVFYGTPDEIFPISATLQGVAINPVTRTAALTDANATGTNGAQIDLLNSLDQSVSSIFFQAACSAFTTSCASSPELLGTTAVGWQPYTNALVSYNPQQNQVSISDPVSRQRYAFACNTNSAPPVTPGTCVTNPSTPAEQQTFLSQIVLNGKGTATLNVQNGTTNSLTLFGGLAVDPVTNQAFVVKSGSGTIDVIDLGGPATATPIKPTHISELIVPSPTPGLGAIGGIPNALVPQATLTCVPAPSSPPGTCNLSGVQIFGSGFASGLHVRLDGVDITTQGGTINNIASNGREVDVTIPAFFLSAPHHYALDVLSNNAPSNAVDFLVVQSVDMSQICPGAKDANGNPVLPQPTSVAIADQLANGPFSPIAVVSNYGCNSISVIDLSPGSATFGQLIGSPIPVGTGPKGIAIWQQKGLAVVANNGTTTASIIDLTKKPPAPIVPDVTNLGSSPTGVAINDATGAAIVANTGSNTVSMINLALLFPSTGTAPTTLSPISIGGIQQPVAVAIDPDRGINNQGIAVVTAAQLSSGSAPSGALAVVEIGLATPALSTTNPSGFVSATATGIVFDPAVFTGTANPGVFFANSSGSNVITQFNPDTGGGSSVNVGINPTSLAVNPQTGAILTSNSASNTISVVDTLSNPFKTRQTLGIPGSPTFGVAIDQFTNLAVIVDQANNRVLLFPMPN
jgi:DNA-binding beta-propeller fold protein YncE